MVDFDVMNFTECRSEEVMSFFWRSVYVVTLQYSLSQSPLEVYFISLSMHIIVSNDLYIIKRSNAIWVW